MKQRRRKGVETAGAAALRLWEEAFHLARTAPASAVCYYLCGTVPFLLGLLYFWAEMSRGPEAARYAAPASLGLAVLFFWMKTGQAMATRVLGDRLRGRDPEPVRVREMPPLFGRQIVLQGGALLAVPFAALIVFPLAWVYTFFQCSTVFSARRETDWRAARTCAFREASRRPWGDGLALLFLVPLGLLLFLNLALAIYAAPWLLKVLLGIETVFGTGGWNPLNSTLLLAGGALVYLMLGFPLQAFYTLRCFYGESVHNGEDLAVELRRIRWTGGAAIAVLLFAGTTIAVAPAMADEAARDAAEFRADPALTADLDRSLDRVLRDRIFRWRLGERAEEPEDESSGWLVAAVERFRDTVSGWLRTAGNWVERFFDWLLDRSAPHDSAVGPGVDRAIDWPSVVRLVLWVLAAGLAAFLIYCVARMVLERRRTTAIAESPEPAAAVPDMDRDDLLPTERAPAEWEELAGRFWAQGDLRLALRASYLSLLAFLGEREWISPARHKSNADYTREIDRRAGEATRFRAAFSDSVRLFERCWYGEHAVTPETWEQFQRNRNVLREEGRSG